MAVNPERIKELREGLGLSQSELARRVGVTPQAVQQLEDGKVRDPRYIVALAEILGVPPAGLGRDGGAGPPRESHPIRHEPLGRKDLPVYASAQGGPEGSMVISYDPIEWRERPSILEAVPDAFAMYVINDSMEPRYRQGDLLLVHPRRPVRPGNDVLCVKMSGNREHLAMIKQLLRVNSKEVVLLQYNPRKEIVVPRKDVADLYRVMGAYWSD
jgi:phage repressor protein C with HTH and peptisase S24 domain/DNA-binding XRE family transcriptional regulator